MKRALVVSLAGLVLSLSSPAGATPPTYICMTDKCHPSFKEQKFIHGPMGGGMCPLCHDSGTKAEGLPPEHPEVMIEKSGEQCLLCHEGIRLLLTSSFVHTPVAEGDCIDCHSPHGGEDSFFLYYPSKTNSGRRLFAETCQACHEEGDPAWYDDFHAGEKILDCVVCHNSHASSEKYQLTRYVRDIYLRSTLTEARELQKEGRLEGSAEAYRKALSVLPGNVEIVLDLAAVYGDQGEWERAADEYDEILGADPSNLEALAGAAEAAARLEDQAGSMAHLKKAVEIAPERADLHLKVGLIYLDRGQLQEALSEMSRAVEIDPGYAEAYLSMADVLDAMGRPEEARQAQERHRSLQRP